MKLKTWSNDIRELKVRWRNRQPWSESIQRQRENIAMRDACLAVYRAREAAGKPFDYWDWDVYDHAMIAAMEKT